MALGNRELVVIRHAPVAAGSRLCGRRTDPPAALPGEPAMAALRDLLGRAGLRVTSPALRCRQTAAALWPALPGPPCDPRLWEQDFGLWDGLALAEVPDLGPLPPGELAAHRPPEGESFEDMAERVAPALLELARAVEGGAGPAVAVAHAGTVRAALALALGGAGPGGAGGAALAFEVPPLSLVRLRVLDGSTLSVIATGWSPA